MNRTNRRPVRGPQPEAAWLAAALREKAHEHEANPDRIAARFERLTAGESRPGEPRQAGRRRPAGPARLRLIVVPLGLLALASAVVAVAVSLGLGNGRTAHLSSQVAAPPTSRGSAATGPGPDPLATSSAVIPPAATPAPGNATPAPGDTAATRPAGALTASGTVDPHSFQYWAQENVTVTTTRPVRELRVTVTVSGGSTVHSTGSWTTLLPAEVETTVRTVPDGLVYQITLKAVQVLQPAAYALGFQFDRPASGHDFALDTYRASAVTVDGASVSAAGQF